MEIGPGVVLSVVVGIFHTALYVLLTGGTRGRLVLLAPAAVLGAWAGQALGDRLGDPLRVGDFGLLWASLLAWVGIGVVVLVAVLGPSRPAARRRGGRPAGG